ncbi:MAG: hypothetical protein JO104_06715 [Candidatus Eremiobacteraeota bacterium]|nr:hypothetical protein [Candidatus Eremiobacteraeota bacterium]
MLSACAAPPIISANGAVATARAPVATRTINSSSSTVVVSDASQNDIVVFCARHTACNDCKTLGSVPNVSRSVCHECKTIGSGLSMPQGVATAGSGGDLAPSASTLDYVADFAHQRVVVFTDACNTVRVLDDSGYFPSDVAVAFDGTVAVTNLCPAPSCSGAGNISFYAPGSSNVTRVATGLMSQYYYGDFDGHGNFYNDGLSGNSVQVGVVPYGSTSDMATGISDIGVPGGIQVARNGTINIDDPGCLCIQIYRGSRRVGTVSLSGVVKPVTFALDKSDTHLWVTDVSSKMVDEFPYPAGGEILDQLSGFSEPIGVGVVPSDKP